MATTEDLRRDLYEIRNHIVRNQRPKRPTTSAELYDQVIELRIRYSPSSLKPGELRRWFLRHGSAEQRAIWAGSQIHAESR